MEKELFEKLFNLQDSDYQMILDGLEALKSKDLAGEMLGSLFTSMLMDKKKMTPEQLQEFEDKEKKEKEEKERKQIEIKGRIDVLKSKITLILESRRIEDFRINSIKLGNN